MNHSSGVGGWSSMGWELTPAHGSPCGVGTRWPTMMTRNHGARITSSRRLSFTQRSASPASSKVSKMRRCRACGLLDAGKDLGELAGDAGAGRGRRHIEAFGKGAQLGVHVRGALEVESPAGQVRNLSALRRNCLVRWDLPVSLTPWMGRRRNGAARVMSCAKARCASLWSATGQSSDGATSGQSGPAGVSGASLGWPSLSARRSVMRVATSAGVLPSRSINPAFRTALSVPPDRSGRA